MKRAIWIFFPKKVNVQCWLQACIWVRLASWEMQSSSFQSWLPTNGNQLGAFIILMLGPTVISISLFQHVSWASLSQSDQRLRTTVLKDWFATLASIRITCGAFPAPRRVGGGRPRPLCFWSSPQVIQQIARMENHRLRAPLVSSLISLHLSIGEIICSYFASSSILKSLGLT